MSSIRSIFFGLGVFELLFVAIMTLIITIPIFCDKDFRIKIFSEYKYGKYIGKLFIITGIIQCAMASTMSINSFETAALHMFVFEGFALCQQALYFIIILLVGGVYNENGYDSKATRNKVNLFFFILCKSMHHIQNNHSINTKIST